MTTRLTKVGRRGSTLLLAVVARVRQVLLALGVVLVATLTAPGSAGAATTDASRSDATALTRHDVVAVSIADGNHVPPVARCSAAANRGYDDGSHLARAVARPDRQGLAPQTTRDPDCSDSVVIGESGQRTAAAAAAFGGRIWSGPPFGSSHLETCAANEAWLRGEIASGTRVIDIGIEDSRQGSRSPNYALELRILDETGYPVDRRPWPASPSRYTPPDPGPCP